jgi:hypothetical protein
MKIVYVKIEDPIAWREPTSVFYEEDKDTFVCNVVRYTGILIDENDKRIVLGEVEISQDNPKLHEFGIKFPRYRGITIIAKKMILDRQDFEIKED